MISPSPSTTLPSPHRAAAKAIALAVDTGLLPDPAAARDIMEALGLLAPGGREILPDPPKSLLPDDGDDLLPLLGKGRNEADYREPPMDRRFVPPGLRNLSVRKQPTRRPKCGTPAGYRAHLANDENACLPCCDAERDRAKKIRASNGVKVGEPGRRPSSEIDHGTERGYRKHLRRKVPMCEPCLLAAREISRERKRKKSGFVPSPIEHGTNAGYMKERRRGLTPCDLCRRAATKHRAGNKRTRAARTATPTSMERKSA